ncbi:branched-chain amino acid ABC transporter permease [Roseococcus sp. SDR]|uniref:branched-chain amino acid ABC transporter permease n=1 Tax=Roseococcus sp. SDR TaxID=2835532 RepID=UPI001BCB6D6D|nr:branched-chain amino acid ABC transporter permease [Roseococcus sp. SDR]MBS7792941.1 branched-chain amino acid ABC transporter permease [Roseococcus sp. SDR]MBV1848255.1 branched-chain amino acid ABC transporter permease [Roseococcus sp. SDR]
MLFVQLLLQGLQVGAIYALTAAGFALIFGATRIFHFAHGSSFALAGYVFIFAMQAGWPWWMGGLAATLTATLFGIGVFWFVYRPIQRHEGSFFTVFVAAFGVGIVVQNLIGMTAGRGFASVDTPLSRAVEVLPDVFLAQVFWVAVGVAAILFAALTLFLTRHNAGVALRALHQNPDLLRAYGLSSTRLSLLAFALGSALAAPAAMVTAMTSGMNEAIGHQVMLISMAATIVGGVGSLRGAALAGLMLGVAESVALNFVDTQWAEAVSFLVLFAFIIFRPSGIFGIAQAR